MPQFFALENCTVVKILVISPVSLGRPIATANLFLSNRCMSTSCEVPMFAPPSRTALLVLPPLLVAGAPVLSLVTLEQPELRPMEVAQDRLGCGPPISVILATATPTVTLALPAPASAAGVVIQRSVHPVL